MAASLLLLQESGGVATDVHGGPLGRLRCDLETRTTLLCAPTRELHAEALKLLRPRR
jgi:fructose-1,6-bisphosphatase/inositol monophosphatase family enzyme